ncbi:MAG: class I SAM-dependent methyltransferase [Acidimicrobiales bacterium]
MADSETGTHVDRVAAKWDRENQRNLGADKNLRTRWWKHPYVLRRVNQRLCGEPEKLWGGGMHRWLERRFGDELPFQRAISVGGGTGGKEMDLIESGIVEHMTVYEYSESRIETGKNMATRRGLEDQVEFVCGDAFALEQSLGSFDLVHWDNSLHHMLDVAAAVEWSRSILRSGGLFYLYGFIGPSRFQWTQPMLDLASEVRSALPASYLEDPNNPSELVIKEFSKPPSIRSMIANNPSEAADSDRILSSVRGVFPNADIILTGGVVYSLALNDIIHNFSWDPVDPYLRLLMALDFQAADAGLSHYAGALALKH